MPKPTFNRNLQFFSKINVLDIVKNHIDTLKDYNVTSYSIFDIFFFFIFPFLLSVFFVYLQIRLNKDLVGILINVFSIFAGLLFNLLILIYDVISKIVKSNNPNPNVDKLKIDTLEHLYFNISFEILLSLFIVILLSVSTLFTNSIANLIFSIFVFSFVITFSLTLLMVLKRVNKLLSHEIKVQRNSIS
ncbi:MAG: hypothetical protein RMY30_036250 [Nostoc sp. CmiSLP01]|nr:hypothetical protein [Nostoc sp. CmiSLP01]MDZ8282017.1 hypothetical protein [Nostoc sp. ChiSLP01]